MENTSSPQDQLEQLRAELAAVEAERDRLVFVLDSIPDYVAYVDADLVYRYLNRKYAEESGKPIETFLGRSVETFVGRRGLAKIRPHVDRVLAGETVAYEEQVDYRFRAQQDVEVFYVPHRSADNRVVGFSVYVRNITDQRRAEEVLRQQAQYDPLTELPNRHLFYKQLERAMGRADRLRSQVTLFFFDLDGFKQINDTLGHDVGDQVLQDVARMLLSHFRRHDTLARMGGDEFVLLVEDIENQDHAKRLAAKIVASVSHLPTPHLKSNRLSASVGVACYPHDAKNARDLLILADHAMYKAKRLGKNRYFFFGESDDLEN